jgi:hypothetical protein
VPGGCRTLLPQGRCLDGGAVRADPQPQEGRQVALLAHGRDVLEPETLQHRTPSTLTPRALCPAVVSVGEAGNSPGLLTQSVPPGGRAAA